MYSEHSPFDAANEFDKAITLWRADKARVEDDLQSKEAIETRAMDLYRNNDTMRGIVDRLVGAVVGEKVTLNSEPQHEKFGVSQEEAESWARLVEREFHEWADSPENWISANRSMDLTQLARQAYKSKVFTGEIAASREWQHSPLGYKTCINLISPSRIVTPAGHAKRSKIFFGIEFNKHSAPLAYHIEEAKPGQTTTFKQKRVRRFAKYNEFNQRQIYHEFDPLMPEYPRGISQLAAILKRLKNIDRFNEAELDKQILAASFTFLITSDQEDPEVVADMLSGANSIAGDDLGLDDSASELPPEVRKLKEELLGQMRERKIEQKGGSVMHLFSGEDAKILNPSQNTPAAGDYVKHHLRGVSNGAGLSYELATGDYQGLSFSGGQLSLGSLEPTLKTERRLFAHKFLKWVYRLWLDEAIQRGTVPTLGGRNYWRFKEAYSRCYFTGSRRVYVDPVKGERRNAMALEAGTTSRTRVAADNGEDFPSITKERAREAKTAIEAIESQFEITLDRAERMDLINRYVVGETKLAFLGDGGSNELQGTD